MERRAISMSRAAAVVASTLSPLLVACISASVDVSPFARRADAFANASLCVRNESDELARTGSLAHQLSAKLHKNVCSGNDGQKPVVCRRVRDDLFFQTLCRLVPLSPNGRISKRNCRGCALVEHHMYSSTQATYLSQWPTLQMSPCCNQSVNSIPRRQDYSITRNEDKASVQSILFWAT